MINSIKTVISENLANYKITLRLATFEAKNQHKGSFLGVLWNVINPAIQIFIFWFVFNIGIRGGEPIGNLPFLIWLMAGLIPWFYMSSMLTGTANSLRQYKGIISNIKLPLSIVPIKSIFSFLIHHLTTMLIYFVVFFMYRLTPTFHIVFVLYYLIAIIAFFLGWALLSSAITVLFPDFNKFLGSVVRLIFFVSPIMWSFDNLPRHISQILRLNPLAYIVEGYRHALLFGNSPLAHWRQGLYFWVISLILFAVGSYTHCRLRKKFVDLL